MVVGADAVRGDDEENVLSGPGAVGSGGVDIADLAAGMVRPAGDLGGRGQGGSGHASILPPGAGARPTASRIRPAPIMGRRISRASCSHRMITPVRNMTRPQYCRRDTINSNTLLPDIYKEAEQRFLKNQLPPEERST